MHPCGSRTKHVADIAPQLRCVLRRNVCIAGDVLIQEVFGLRVDEVAFIGEGGGDSTGNVTKNLGFTKDRFASQSPPHVRVQSVGDITAGYKEKDLFRLARNFHHVKFGPSLIGTHYTWEIY